MDHMNWVLSVAFSRNGKQIATGECDGGTHIWDTSTGKNLQTSANKVKHLSAEVLFSSDNDHITIRVDGRIVRIIDTFSGRLLTTLATDHQGGISSVKLSRDYTHMATASRDGAVHIWKNHEAIAHKFARLAFASALYRPGVNSPASRLTQLLVQQILGYL